MISDDQSLCLVRIKGVTVSGRKGALHELKTIFNAVDQYGDTWLGVYCSLNCFPLILEI